MAWHPNPHRLDSRKSPGFLKRTGLELDIVRPLQAPVSPSAPTRNVEFGSAPCHRTRSWKQRGGSIFDLLNFHIYTVTDLASITDTGG